MARAKAPRREFQIMLEGPFFERDPAKTFRQNARRLMDSLASEGEADVRSQIAGQAGSMPHYTGWTADTVQGRTSSLTGRRWALSLVISANTAGMDRKDAIRTKAAGASIERRWHPFRKTARAMRRSRALLVADLTRGLE